MDIRKIDPMDYPLSIGESWWVIHPNSGEAELSIPVGAPAVCTKDFLDIFKKNAPYRIAHVDDSQGWISIESPVGEVVEMPRYIFARHFDAVAYIRRSGNACSENEE